MTAARPSATPECPAAGDEKYPRVLVVSPSAFNSYTGGGVFLSNLFRGWPAERLAAIHSDSVAAETAVCQRYYDLLSRSEIEFVWPLSVMPARWLPRPDRPSAHHGEMGDSARTAAPRVRARRLLRRLAHTIVGEVVRDRIRLSPQLLAWVDAFRPELIFTLLGSLGYMRLVRRVAARSGAAVVVHMMDDWPTTSYRGALLSPILRRAMNRELRAVLAQSAVRLGISPPMCRAYEARYGVPFVAFCNVLDLEAWLPYARRQWSVAAPVRLAYVGSVFPSAQLQSLRDMCDAVVALRAAGLHIEFRIYTPTVYAHEYRHVLERDGVVTVEDAPDNDGTAALLGNADILVLPVNFDRRSIEYIRYSLPAKIPAYLISGTPILAYGPAEVAQIALAREQGWGWVVDRPGPEGLQAAIRQLADSTTVRERLGRRAQEVALRDYDASRVRPMFHRALMMASGRPARGACGGNRWI